MDDVLGWVPLQNLSDTPLDRLSRTIGTRGQIAGRQGIQETVVRRGQLELRAEFRCHATLFGLTQRTRMVCDEPAEQRVGSLHIAQVSRAVQRMKPGHGEVRGIPDVMQPSRGLDQAGVISQPISKLPRPPGHTLGVRPASRQRLGEQLLGEVTGPSDNVLHGLDSKDARPGTPSAEPPISKDVLGRLVVGSVLSRGTSSVGESPERRC
jgi:hypothetical protein